MRALAVIALVAAAVIVVCRIFTSNAFDIFVWSGVIGTLILPVAYILATLGAVRMLWFRGRAMVATWQIVIPVAALLVLLATIYYTVDPSAPKATRWNYYTAGAWVIGGAILVLILPGLASRVGQGLSRHEGLGGAESAAGERRDEPSTLAHVSDVARRFARARIREVQQLIAETAAEHGLGLQAPLRRPAARNAGAPITSG